MSNLVLPIWMSIGNDEHLALRNSQEPTGTKTPVDRSPAGESRYRTEADELRDILKAATGYSSYAD